MHYALGWTGGIIIYVVTVNTKQAVDEKKKLKKKVNYKTHRAFYSSQTFPS
jgi:hypothetical protein